MKKQPKKISNFSVNEDFSNTMSLAVEQSANIVFITDIDGKFEYVNKKFTEITAYSLNEVSGKTPRIFKTKDKNNKFYKNLWETIKSGKVWRGEFKNIDKLGNIFWDSTTITPLKSNNGEIIKFLAVKEIITKKKKITKSLIQSEKNLKNIFDFSNDTIIIHDFFGKMLAVNNSFCKRLGYTYDEAMELKLEDFDVEENPDRFKKIMREIREHGYSIFETIDISKNREFLFTEVISKVIDFNEKKAILSIGRDITERKKFEKKLERSERKYRVLTETLNDVVIRVSLTGELLYVSPQIKELSGYEPEEITGKPFANFLSRKSEITMAFKLLSEVSHKKNSGTFEFFIRDKKGKEIPVENSYAPVIENGKVLYVHLVMRNNTEKRRNKEALLKAKKDAEAGANMQAAFLANMSHEIRTPMNGILGFTQLLKQDNLKNEDKLEFIDIILESGKHLLSLIDDIINISKIDAGFIKPHETKCSINYCLRNIFKFFNNNISEKSGGKTKLIVNYALAAGEDYVYTDETKLRQILINLIGNAAKFTKKGTITLNSSKYNDDFLLFSVEDTGIGIPLKYQELIFERFRQIDESTTRKHGGTGLGLAISRAYVEMLGGKIWIESSLKKGSKFYFTIPYKT